MLEHLMKRIEMVTCQDISKANHQKPIEDHENMKKKEHPLHNLRPKGLLLAKVNPFELSTDSGNWIWGNIRSTYGIFIHMHIPKTSTKCN